MTMNNSSIRVLSVLLLITSYSFFSISSTSAKLFFPSRIPSGEIKNIVGISVTPYFYAVDDNIISLINVLIRSATSKKK
ncbi:MAG: hypothetical protein COA38_15055 [Fluviicola sp.]|nr:MAG: hypothetical protein COA38_15055 [Fluviicola sp.]